VDINNIVKMSEVKFERIKKISDVGFKTRELKKYQI